jgi:hypothetical protein
MGLQNGGAHGGSWAAVAVGGGSGTAYAVKTFGATYPTLYVRVWFRIVNRSTTVNLLRLQSATGDNILTVFVASGGALMLRNDVQRANVSGTTMVSGGAWHQVQVRVKVAGSSSLTEVWYDGQRISELSTTLHLGTAPVGRLMLGDNVQGRTYRLLFDDVAASQSRL